MNDIKIWINDCRDNLHSVGLNELNWIMHHMNMNIFKIGRLQYQKMFYYMPNSYKKNGNEIKFGDKIWNVHICRGEKLNFEACEKSFIMAQEFIKKYSFTKSGKETKRYKYKIFGQKVTLEQWSKQYLQNKISTDQFLKIIDFYQTKIPKYDAKNYRKSDNSDATLKKYGFNAIL